MSSKGKILVVDDSESHRAVIIREVEKLGYGVAAAGNGADAIRMVNAESYDLVLLDVVMPGLDGFATLRALRQLHPIAELPVIMLTARDEADDVIQALRLGANDYAVKPIRLNELAKRIETHLKIKRGKDETLGNYRLLGKLGEGAMGVVYEADRLRGEGKAAVKILPRSLTVQKAAVQRFLQEGALISKVEHPNVVSLYDIGKEGDTYYLAMELIVGKTLDKLCAGKPMKTELAFDIVRQTSLGLKHLLEHGIIHRDIKPQNIIYTDNGCVKIADFGIARDVSRDFRLTQEGTGLGSLVYAPPEQIAGKADPRSDMYSLGGTLFEMLTGAPPFPKNKPLQWMIEAKYGKVPNIMDVRADLSKDIARFIARLMSPKPTKRYPSYDDLIVALDKLALNFRK